MSKIIKFDREAKEKLQAGIKKVHDAVTITMGPFGRNVLIEKEHGQVTSTKDGVTVAKSFHKLDDDIENIGAQLVKQVSIKSANEAGDGTTTSTLLATTMIEEGINLINNLKFPSKAIKGIPFPIPGSLLKNNSPALMEIFLSLLKVMTLE